MTNARQTVGQGREAIDEQCHRPMLQAGILLSEEGWESGPYSVIFKMIPTHTSVWLTWQGRQVVCLGVHEAFFHLSIKNL